MMIFIPRTNRVCGIHLNDGLLTDQALTMIKANKQHFMMEGDEITSWIKKLVNSLDNKSTIMDFSRDSNFKSEDYELLLGVTKDEFFELYSICKPHLHSSKNRNKANAVALLLMKLRLDLSQKVLALLFGISSQPRVSQTISHVAEVLDKYYVVHHVGFGHITREQALSHNSGFSHAILQSPQDSLHLTIDGTYIDVQKSSNFVLQKETYCTWKKKNLVKPTMIIFDDGYIYDANKMWASDNLNNDASILKKILEKEGEKTLRSILHEGMYINIYLFYVCIKHLYIIYQFR
jgi:hypothetical protein